MPTRFATSLTHSLLCALFLALASAGGAKADEPRTELTLPQARALAAQALRDRRPDLALQLGRGLLKADPRDPFAHYVIASAYAQAGLPREGRQAAARAYRYSETSPDRFRSAQLAAQLAYREGNPTLAQLWLRRTANYTQSERDEQLLARDYQLLRRQNPWSFAMSVDIRPSSNVNNGASTQTNIIDGVPDQGTLPAAAQALSGVIGTFNGVLGYRLRASDTSATYLTGRVYLQRVSLSSEAKAKAPKATGSDFSYSYYDLALRHDFAAGPPEAGGSATVELGLGESWYSGQRNYRSVRLSTDRTWRLSPDSQILLNGLVERRFMSRYTTNDARVLGIGTVYGRRLASGDTLVLSAALRDTQAKAQNGTYSAVALRAGYDFAEPFGPVAISAAVGMEYADYPSFDASLFLPATRRQDTTVYGDLTLFFPDYDYAGFAPALRIRAGKKTSNFSRFDSREFSVSLGIRSKF